MCCLTCMRLFDHYTKPLLENTIGCLNFWNYQNLSNLKPHITIQRSTICKTSNPYLDNIIGAHIDKCDVTSHEQTLCLYWTKSRPAYRVDNIYRDTPIELSWTQFPHSCKTSLFNYSPGWGRNLEQENYLPPHLS